MKKIVFCVLLLTLLLSFCTVFADQDGRNCWCNIDEYGCWITGEDSGKTYIMDPNFNKEYGSKVASPTKYPLGFYIRYGSAKTLMYCRPDKTEIEKNGKA